jgi:hypothetical protein
MIKKEQKQTKVILSCKKINQHFGHQFGRVEKLVGGTVAIHAKRAEHCFFTTQSGD